MARIRARSRTRSAAAFEYAAFISYSHALDGRLGAAVQTGLERFTKPWYRMRALRVFRDKISLSASPGLWSSIEDGLQASEWMLLMAAPQAARSPWVRKEIGWWRAHRPMSRLLVVLTDGQLVWDPARGDFDWSQTDALPEEVLGGAFTEEPYWIDLRWARDEAHVDQSNPQFRDCIATLAAPIHGVPKDQLVGEHVQQHRRTIRLARAAAAGLTALAVTATAAATIANDQRNDAREQSRIALARQVAAAAEASAESRLDVAQLLSVAAYEMEPTPQATTALLRAVTESPHLVGYLHAGAPVSALTSSRNGNVLAAGTEDGRVLTWDLSTNRRDETDLGDQPVQDVALDRRGTRVAATDGDRVLVWERTAGSPPIEPAVTARSPASRVALSPSGATVAVLYQPHSGDPLDPGELTSEEQLLVLFGSDSGVVQAWVKDEFFAFFLGFRDESRVLTGSFDAVGSVAWTRSGPDLSPAQEWTAYTAPFNNYRSAFSADGSHYAYVKHGGVLACLFGGGEGRCGGGTVPTKSTEAFAISLDGKQAAVATGGKVYLTPVAASHQPDARSEVVLTGNNEISHLTYLGTTDRLASSSGSAIALWDPSQIGRLAQPSGIRVPYGSFADPVPTIALAPDGNRIAIFGGGSSDANPNPIYDLRTGRAIANLELQQRGTPVFTAWSEDGEWLAASTFDGTAGWVWDLQNTDPQLVARWRHSENDTSNTPNSYIDVTVRAIRILADQRQLMTVDSDGQVVVRDLDDGRLLQEHRAVPPGDEIAIDAAAISVDGQQIALAWDDTLELLGNDGEPQASASVTGASPIGQVEFASEGTVVARGQDSTIEVWDPRTGQGDRQVTDGGRSRQPVAISPDGDLVVSLHDDGVAIVTDLVSGRRIGSFPLPEPEASLGGGIGENTSLAFDRQSRTLVTATAGGTVLRWDLSEAGWLRIACETAGQSLTAEQWRRSIGSEPPATLPCRSRYPNGTS